MANPSQGVDLPILIIGGGIGGFSAAIRLAAAGYRAAIYEQNPIVGGKMGEFRADGFRWDTGPSVITMRNVFDDLFSAAGRKLDDYLRLERADPLTRYFYPDGRVLDVTGDRARMVERLAAFAPEDVDGYKRFLDYAASLYRITSPVFIYDEPPSFRSLTRVPITDALRIDPLRTMHEAIRGHVRSPHLQQLLGRFATYVGASPYRAPATLSLIAHVELNEGVWYPRGGIYSIARAFERLACELGIEIHTGCGVQQIVVENGAARGLILADGQRIEGQAVIANVDVATVYERLLPSSAVTARQVQKLTAAEQSCSGYILLLGVDGQHPQLAHHNIFFSQDYTREFDQIFRQGVPPDDPTIYVAITSKTDREDAPDGMENWFVLINVPPNNPRFDWQREGERYRDLVLSRLADRGLKLRLRSQHSLTPMDLERLTGARNGALYGLSSNDRFSAFNRPHNRCPDVHGLYFAGGTTHPGGGVPMVTLSGGVAARLLMQDLERSQRKKGTKAIS